MTKTILTFSLVLLALTAKSQTDTTFYTNAGGKITDHNKSEVAYYELNNGFNRNGLTRQFYPDHSLYAEVDYLDNHSTGNYKKYYKNGRIKEQRSSSGDDNQRFVTRWYQNGQKCSETEYIFEDGERINRRAQGGGSVVSKLINSWDSLGNQQVSNSSGLFNAPIFDDGRYWEKGEYLDGKKVGKWIGTKSGQADYEEEYDQNGELVSGVSYDEDGSTKEYNVFQEVPTYPGGEKKWVRFLQKNLKYPKVARKAKVEGSVYMTFIVDKFGLVSNVEVISGIGSGCDKEAIRVLELSKQWLPGIERGRPVKSRMALRLDFRLR